MKFDLSSDDIKVYDFNALQAYKIGRHLEEEGINFYNNILKGQIKDPDVNDAIRILIKEEKEHFEILQNKIEAIATQEEDGFEEEDLEDFLDTNVVSHFRNLKKKKDIFHNRREAIEFGIMMENRSIMFYKALLKHTDDLSGKEAINELISQESIHLMKLKELTK